MLAVILTGGRSSRMGRDKAMLPVGVELGSETEAFELYYDA